jgi:hypothetical protein
LLLSISAIIYGVNFCQQEGGKGNVGYEKKVVKELAISS